ncbi:membrane protein FxsA [Natronomonas gomsonensis]|uniref:FxsA family protein n=1 Tax=Natronomonas gomsonensis TaxID=1046043 RepID=UPI0020CA5AA2|nr:FxsA family protein [Natronomonas gomsonensis]MCY4732202.1 membrane protein FxsA [Natronomonas gomsonensis]
MDLRVIGVLLLVPLLDIMLLVVLATQLGGVVTVALVVLTALIGLLLARAEGRHTLQRLQRKLAQGEPPTDELLDAALLLVAGVLMLTPGLVTDLLGLLLVLPPTRYPIRVFTKRYVVKPYVDAQTGGFASGNVYIGGFPNADEGGDPGEEFFRQGMDEGRPGSEPVDIDEEAYEFTDPDGQTDDDGDDDGSTDRRA